jgi:hypothetical protein
MKPVAAFHSAMKSRAVLLSTILSFTVLTFPCSQAAPNAAGGDALLANIMDRPGWWSQMCDPGRPVAFNVPVPLFSPHVAPRYFRLLSENPELSADRPVLVAALKKALSGMDLQRPPAEAMVKPPEDGRSGMKPGWFNPIHLALIKRLQAVEVLPDLLRLEEQLYKLIEAAEKDSAAPLPDLPLDSPVQIEGGEGKALPLDWTKPSSIRRRALFECRIFQREMLGVTLQLLRGEQWRPVMESALEKSLVEKFRHGAGPAEAAKKAEREASAKFKAVQEDKSADSTAKAKALEEMEQAREKLNAEVELPPMTAPFTPGLRAQIRGWAADFLANVPPEKWRGAAAMPKDSP